MNELFKIDDPPESAGPIERGITNAIKVAMVVAQIVLVAAMLRAVIWWTTGYLIWP